MSALGLRPETRLPGEIVVPGSKSIAQRALLAASLASGPSRLRGLPPPENSGEDIGATLCLLDRLGIATVRGAGELIVEGRGPGLPAPSGPLELGESGTLARCATAILALCGKPGAEFRLEAAGSLRARGHPALLEALGDRVLAGPWPTCLRSAPPTDECILREPRSSQEVSGLLLALAAHAGEHTLRVEGPIPSRPYVELTRSVLARFGARVELDGARFAVRGPLTGCTLDLEPDASLAAVALVAGCLADSRAGVRVPGLPRDSAQGDVRILEHLRAFGCEAAWSDSGATAVGRPLRGVELDLAGEPDLAPVLAVVAAAAATLGHASRLTGLGTLPGKESSRIEVLVEGLSACGWRVRGDGESLSFEPGGPHDTPVLLDPHGDHRMAFAFALAGLLRPGVRVSDTGCTAKSWPSFWQDLGAR